MDDISTITVPLDEFNNKNAPYITVPNTNLCTICLEHNKNIISFCNKGCKCKICCRDCLQNLIIRSINEKNTKDVTKLNVKCLICRKKINGIFVLKLIEDNYDALFQHLLNKATELSNDLSDYSNNNNNNNDHYEDEYNGDYDRDDDEINPYAPNSANYESNGSAFNNYILTNSINENSRNQRTGGGLMQLVAYGAQDVYITGNAQITFFREIYRRHANFIE